MTPTQHTNGEQHAPNTSVSIVVLVEGTNDIEFLRRISRLLHADDAALPDLGAMEQRGELIFVPFGGGQVQIWTNRFAPLAKPEFHIYDRELPPETDYRQAAAEAVNRRARCRAVLTNKRCLENYLLPPNTTTVSVSDDLHKPHADLHSERTSLINDLAFLVVRQHRRQHCTEHDSAARRSRNKLETK